MFPDRTGNPGSPPKGSAISRGLSLLGTVTGIATTILLTPLVYGLTNGPLHAYLNASYGPDLAFALTLLIGGIEAIVIYIVTNLSVVGGATWAVVTLASRRSPIA